MWISWLAVRVRQHRMLKATTSSMSVGSGSEMTQIGPLQCTIMAHPLTIKDGGMKWMPETVSGSQKNPSPNISLQRERAVRTKRPIHLGIHSRHPRTGWHSRLANRHQKTKRTNIPWTSPEGSLRKRVLNLRRVLCRGKCRILFTKLVGITIIYHVRFLSCSFQAAQRKRFGDAESRIKHEQSVF